VSVLVPVSVHRASIAITVLLDKPERFREVARQAMDLAILMLDIDRNRRSHDPRRVLHLRCLLKDHGHGLLPLRHYPGNSGHQVVEVESLNVIHLRPHFLARLDRLSLGAGACLMMKVMKLPARHFNVVVEQLTEGVAIRAELRHYVHCERSTWELSLGGQALQRQGRLARRRRCNRD